MSKKQSLFKQKLRQNKQIPTHVTVQEITKNEIQSFPKVFKLQSFDIKESYNSLKQQKIENQSQRTAFQKNQDAEQSVSTSFLQKKQNILSSIISQQQYSQINHQNWNAVDSMNEQERLNYINLIENTLPKHFIQKLRKKQKLTQQLPQKSLITQKLQQMIPQISDKKFTNTTGLKQIHQKEKISDQNQDQEDMQNHKNTINQVYLNVKAGKLVYFAEDVLFTLSEDEKDNLINKNKLYEMVKSQNNQSQMIASQLTLMWMKNLFLSEDIVFFIDKIPFHKKIILSELYGILVSIQNIIKTTSFYSCYIQMIVQLAQTITLVYKLLPDSFLIEQGQFFKQQFQKSQKSLKSFLAKKATTQIEDKQEQLIDQRLKQNAKIQQRQKQMLFQSLGIIFECLTQQIKLRQQEKQPIQNDISLRLSQCIQKYKNNNTLNDLIETVLIQQTLQKQQFQKYQLFPSINKLLSILTDFWRIYIEQGKQKSEHKLKYLNDFYTVLYSFLCKLNKKLRRFPFYKGLIRNIYASLLHILEDKYFKQVLQTLFSKNDQIFNFKSLNQQQQSHLKTSKTQILYKLLFIYRELCLDQQNLANLLEKQQKNWKPNQDETSVIIFINFNHYLHVQDLTQQEIQMLQNMLNWLKSQLQSLNKKSSFHKYDSEEILLSLLNLFLSSDQQIYSLLDQTLLNQIFTQTIQLYQDSNKKQSHKVQQKEFTLLSEIQIKKMISNYNFNSFGNDIFTKVIFWFAVHFNSDIQSLIGEEVMMRYPMLFYYASEPYSSDKIKNKQTTNSCSLLGNLKNYIQKKKQNKNAKQLTKPHEQNLKMKANLIKLLYLNLNFQTTEDKFCLSFFNFLKSTEGQGTTGFNLSKASLNTQNYFYRYLIQPFLQENSYKQYF